MRYSSCAFHSPETRISGSQAEWHVSGMSHCRFKICAERRASYPVRVWRPFGRVLLLLRPRASPPDSCNNQEREATMSIDTIPATADSREIRLWAPRSEVEAQALAQLGNISRLPWVFHHVAVMGDVHYGKGATVGSVIA